MAGRQFHVKNVSLFIVKKGLCLSVYVDDIKLAGKKQNHDPMWTVLNKEVDLGEPTSFLDHVYLGCTQRQCEISKDTVDNYRTMFESRISAGATEKYYAPKLCVSLHGLIVELPQCFKSLECAQNVFVCCPFVLFFHRHYDVTPSWFRALECHVLRVPNGNVMKKWSSPSSLSSPSVLVWFVAAPRKLHSCLHLYRATTLMTWKVMPTNVLNDIVSLQSINSMH